jgi:hypothetical protein
MLKAQRRTKDLEARKQLVFDMQRYAAEQQYYVSLISMMITGSWQPMCRTMLPISRSTTATTLQRSGWTGRRATGSGEGLDHGQPVVPFSATSRDTTVV